MKTHNLCVSLDGAGDQCHDFVLLSEILPLLKESRDAMGKILDLSQVHDPETGRHRPLCPHRAHEAVFMPFFNLQQAISPSS